MIALLLVGIGGGSASDYWIALLATVLNVPIELPEGSEFGAALGAARLGQLAASQADVETIIKPPKTKAIVAPNSELSESFDNRYWEYELPLLI